MKKVIFYSLALFTLVLAGCKDDSTETPAPSNESPDNVEGNWQYQSVEQKDGVIKLNGFEIATFYTQSKDVDGNLFLKASGRFDSYLEYKQTTFTTDNNGNSSESSQNFPGQTVNGGSYTFNKTANTVTLDDGGDSQTFNITEHTESKLVMEYTYENTTNNQGSEQIVSARVVHTLTK